MRSADEDFDDGIRQKVNAINNEFDEAYWLKAKSLIKADRQFKANIMVFTFVLFALLMAIAVMGFFMQNYQQKLKATSTDLSQADINRPVQTQTVPGQQNGLWVFKSEPLFAVNAGSVFPAGTQIFMQTLQLMHETGVETTWQQTIHKDEFIIEPALHMKTTTNKTLLKQPFKPLNRENERKITIHKSKVENEYIDEIQASNIYDVTMLRVQEKDPVTVENKMWNGAILATTLWDTSNLIKKNFHKHFDKKPKAFYLTAEACLTNFNGSPLKENTISYGIGIKCFYFYSKNFGLSAGIEYRRLHEQLGDRKYVQLSYNFGSNQQIKILTTQRLDYIQIPVWLVYRLNNKNQVNAGINLLAVIQTTDMVQTMQTGDVNLNNVKYEHGYFNAIAATDLQLSVGYSYAATGRLYFHATLYKGLIDITNNKVFKSASADYNKGFTVGIGYKFN
ncbi:MAG: hypothetical protein H7296_04125 [Bacteroidia bacterium]|nr:hypothetical protein [Bacteroidia bacterium]